ncbi:MAG: pyridoxal-phosphate dependent enzyme [Desulfobulbaceae bacterium]|nr:pyridoxal-phosphate dependent enzyme [Desulfobulbaceae bacterium]
MVGKSTYEHRSNIQLFKNFPELEKNIPHISLGNFPSPIQRIQALEEALLLDSLYIKRDDQCSTLYSSNKLRKLEFILGEALKEKRNNVLTVGFAGSNHSLATTIYAKQLGLQCTSLLMSQANAHYVRKNLLASHFFHADLHHYKNIFHLSLDYLCQVIKARIQHGRFPKQIPAGGSCPQGVLGYVNAACELHEQIQQGIIPKPDAIYVTLGSTGTMLGLMLGFRALNMDIRVVGVRAVGKFLAPERNMASLFNKTSRYIHAKSSQFPRLTITRNDLNIRNDCIGKGYADFTEEGLRASKLVYQKCGIVLNGCYTAKTFSAIIDDAEKRRLKGKVVLFWNTYNSCDLTKFTEEIDYTTLPKEFHHYFEEEVQPLDLAEYDK